MIPHVMPTSVITGITGQDGAYLAQQLLSAGDTVYGAFRTSQFGQFLAAGRTQDPQSSELKLVEFRSHRRRIMSSVARKVEPECVYNLAAQSFVGASFEQPIATAQMTGIGALHLLEAIRHVDTTDQVLPGIDFRAVWSRRAVPQNEETPFHPRSPYAVAKLFAHWITVNYQGSIRDVCQQRHICLTTNRRCAAVSS